MVDELVFVFRNFFLNDDKKFIEKKIKFFFKFLSLDWYICGVLFNIVFYLKVGVWNFYYLFNFVEFVFNV